ncbi:rhombosortase [Thauera aromatica]|uniref:rhombosortase n=1 Tax=Thauera aromatica TaxID=59405 RepID=UPI001FFD3A97|nr:rhombosortase [Thauera aromatica]
MTWVSATALALLLLLLSAAGDDARLALRLDPSTLPQQWWRLLTAHFVHLGWHHTLLNVAGVLLCCALTPDVFDRRAAWRIVGLALGISLGLWGLSPDALPYVGLSGVLYGLFVLGLAPKALRRDPWAGVSLALITGWMLWQWWAGALPAEERLIGGRVISIAHLYGYGLAVAALLAMAALKHGRSMGDQRS